MKRVGKKNPKASEMGGGSPRGSEKNVMCQNPMQTIHQNRMSGLGRRMRNRRHVMRMLKARAGERRSSQCVREDLGRIRKLSGNWDGKDMEERPCAEVPMKEVNSPISSTAAQPPFEFDIAPLKEDSERGHRKTKKEDVRLNGRCAHPSVTTVCLQVVSTPNN